MPYKPCSKPGCANLVGRGWRYCPDHRSHEQEDKHRPFEALDKRKTPEALAFYRSRAWTEASARHRRKEPLCRSCRKRGKIRAAEMVHHDPDREIIIAQGGNPLDDKYLVSLCNSCHLEELRNRKGLPRQTRS